MHNRRSTSRRFTLFIIATLVCALWYFPHIVRTTAILHFFEDSTAPFTSLALSVRHQVLGPIQRWQQRRLVRKRIYRMLQQYHSDCENLRSQLVELRALHAYQEDIAELSEFKKMYSNGAHQIAQIVQKTLTPFEQSYILDRGSYSGVEIGMAAVYKNCLIGRVTDVYPTFCRIVLITDTACPVSARSAVTRAVGVHEGFGDAQHTRFSFVSHLETVNTGDMIISSGASLIFPQGFLLGTVMSVHNNGLHLEISIAPAIDFHTLSYCALVKKGTELMPEASC